ncbi:MAG: sulfatase-like hydrolase/transferase [Opitutaceae bacterium]|nr:sulfatase-like hydrolase/transferase [Opitutaceae bacterium]
MTTPPPNILWILTTQWRAQSCGYAGDPNVRTPHLDALAAEAVNFTQAVTPHPFGPFARAAVLTGVPSPANGVRDYFDPLPASSATVAHALRARGYFTAFLGKWHLAARDRHAPLVGEAHARTVVPAAARGGFEWWEGFEGGFLLNDPWLHGTDLPAPVRFPGYQSDVLVERAQRIVTRPAPWFGVLSLEAPHPPYAAPSGDVVPRDPSQLILPTNVPRGGAIEARARRELAGYGAHIEATDRAVGRLLATLPRENTIVVFTSVHGDLHGAHGHFRKGWPHEESVRVPLLVRGPGFVPRRDDAAISLLDLPALTLAWAEGRRPEPTGRGRRISMPSVVALPDQCDRAWRGYRTPARKLVLNTDGSTWLFFDLEQDPGELRNLAADPARAAEIALLRDGVGGG